MNKFVCVVTIVSMLIVLGCNSKNTKTNESETKVDVLRELDMADLNCRDYIEFMEIPIEGDVDTFGKKLSAKGYKFFCEETAMPALVYDGNYLNRDVRIMLDFEKNEDDKKC